VVFPAELTPETLTAIDSTYPGSGNKTIALTTENWETITDDLANVTGPSGTAAAAHLDGVDFAGKTGTAQVMSHDALARTGKGHNTEPNAWFVGMAPRRNPDIVVAVLWEHGNWGNNSAKLAAQVVDAYVNKQRAKAGNLQKVAEAPAAPAVQTPKLDEAPAGIGGVAPATPAGR
jgi:penicillin-binding protein 2